MIYQEPTVYNTIDFKKFGILAKNGWVDYSNLIEDMPDIVVGTKQFYINEYLGLYQFRFKGYSSLGVQTTAVELFKINFDDFISASGTCVGLGINDGDIVNATSFGVYSDFPGYENKVVVWGAATNPVSGGTGISGFGILK